uniref:Uncharacterized protein n=1 Tax=uncultured marine group II/III euryarchaeote KM3_17_G02 TaxID=1457941 RepID=A0A075GM70_9EURY|nr:hypothetical protein [uncultured marine group II/III euryarchaeote KM3_17_G02]
MAAIIAFSNIFGLNAKAEGTKIIQGQVTNWDETAVQGATVSFVHADYDNGFTSTCITTTDNQGRYEKEISSDTDCFPDWEVNDRIEVHVHKTFATSAGIGQTVFKYRALTSTTHQTIDLQYPKDATTIGRLKIWIPEDLVTQPQPKKHIIAELWSDVPGSSIQTFGVEGDRATIRVWYAVKDPWASYSYPINKAGFEGDCYDEDTGEIVDEDYCVRFEGRIWDDFKVKEYSMNNFYTYWTVEYGETFWIDPYFTLVINRPSQCLIAAVVCETTYGMYIQIFYQGIRYRYNGAAEPYNYNDDAGVPGPTSPYKLIIQWAPNAQNPN